MILIPALWFSVAAQQYNFRTLSVAEGLSQSQVLSLYQDSRGYLWFATNGGGVVHFNGYDFTYLTTKEGLTHNTVFDIHETARGDIWLATMQGVSRIKRPTANREPQIIHYQKEQGLTDIDVYALHPYKGDTILFATREGVKIFDGRNFSGFPPTDTIPNFKARKLLVDHAGNIWIASLGKGVFRYDGTTLLRISTKDGLAADLVFSLYEDRHHHIWVGTVAGLHRIKNSKLERFELPAGMKHPLILSYQEDRFNRLWMGSYRDGLLVLDGNNIREITTANGLAADQVWDIIEDRERNLWIGTYGGGVSHFTGERFVHFQETDGMGHNVVWAIHQDRQGAMWFGTQAGLTRMHEGRLTTYTTQNGLVDNDILALKQDRSGRLWIGGENGVAVYDGKNFRDWTQKYPSLQAYIFAIQADSKGNIWIGTQDSGLKKFDGQTVTDITQADGLCEMGVHAVFEDSKGRLWLTSYNGVCLYDGKEFRHFTTDDGLSSKLVKSVAEDSKGNIWLGTEGGGVCLYDEEKFLVFDENNGLTSNTIYLITFDRQDNLWVGTNKGLDRLDVGGYWQTGEMQVRHYGKEEGYIGLESNQNAFCIDTAGHIWFGTIAGATKYDPDYDVPNNIPPVTHISNVRLFFEETEWGHYTNTFDRSTMLPVGLSLPYDKNHLTFDYFAICFSDPGKIRYQFMLEGFDQDWSPPTSSTKATYANIPPGEYTFKVKACNNEGIWNKTATTFAGLTINAPFWQTPWFIGICIAVVLSGFFILLKVRERNLKQAKKVLETKVAERTKEVVRQKEEIVEQNKKIETAYAEIEKKNSNITASIKYAKRIQEAILPAAHHIREVFPESFILFQPRDIVSGDFYWYSSKNGKHIIAAADCTGHGVPGAFMSMIGNTLLNEIVNEKGITVPSEILDQLNAGIKLALKQDEEDSDSKDGMDIALLAIRDDYKELEYAGAYNPLLLVRDGQLMETKADRFPVAGFSLKRERHFSNHRLSIQKDDAIYIFSDGFSDQFGGHDNRKFSIRKFKELLVENRDKAMDEQMAVLEHSMAKWRGDQYDQIDDILVIGIKV